MNRTNLACLVVALSLACTLCSCSAEQAVRAEEAVTQAENNLKAEQERLEAAAAQGQDVGDQIDNIAKLQTQLNQARIVLASMQTPTGPDFGAGIGAMGAALPPPWNLIALIGGPLIGAGLQELRVRRKVKDAQSIVNAIDVARTKSPAVAEGMKVHADAIRGAMTDGAKAIVESERLT